MSGVTGTTYSDGVSLNGRNFKIALIDSNNFNLTEFESIPGGNASGLIYLFQISYVPIIPGSVQINIGAFVYIDRDLDGILYNGSVASGTINYNSGTIVINFSPPIASTPVFIRVVSYNDQQLIDVISTTGAYGGGGLIAKISNFDIQSKIFNFFGDNKRSRLSRVDFYIDKTPNGQFTCNIFGDSSDVPINNPLPDNLQSNVVLTTVSPIQVGSGDETIFRLYCDAIAQTVQFQLTMSDRQMAVTAITANELELLAMMVNMKRGGRLV